MKYITKLSCGHITERLQMDSGNLIKYELEEGGGKLYAYRKWCGKLPWQGRTYAKKGRSFQDASRIYRSAVWKRGSCSIVICWKAPAEPYEHPYQAEMMRPASVLDVRDEQVKGV